MLEYNTVIVLFNNMDSESTFSDEKMLNKVWGEMLN